MKNHATLFFNTNNKRKKVKKPFGKSVMFSLLSSIVICLGALNVSFWGEYVDAFTSNTYSKFCHSGATCTIHHLNHAVKHPIRSDCRVKHLTLSDFRQRFPPWSTSHRLALTNFAANIDEPKSMVNDFKPATMTLTKSMVFFAKYLIQHQKEQIIKRQLAYPDRKISKLWASNLSIHDIGKADAERLKAEVAKEQLEKRPFLETLKSLNDSRKELIELVGYDANLLISCFGFAVLAAFMNSVIPHYYGQSVNCLANAMTTSRPELMKALTGLGVASVLCALFTGIRGALFWLAGSRGNYNIRVKLHRNLLLQEAGFFDSTETGILLSRLNNDVNKIGMVISFHVNVVFRQFAQLIFGAVYLLQISRDLALVSFAGILVIAMVSAIYGDFSRILAERVQNMFADASAVAEKSFSMSETVRAFDGVQTETKKYETAQSRALELEEVQAWAYGTHKFVSDSLQAALQGILLLSCWSFGRAHKLPVSKLTTFMFYVNFVLESSNEVGDQWAKIQSAIGASSNVFDLIRRVPKIRDPVTLRHVLTTSYGSMNGASELTLRSKDPVIKIEDMTVTYGAMDVPALDKINLDVFEGDRVAIVGRSGSGKSTLLRSILRFYDPVSGSCRLEGENLTQLTRQELASRISVVEQEPHLFPMTLMENVLYGIEKDAIDLETGEEMYSPRWRKEVVEALELAGLPVDGANKNNMGLELDTRVGEGGRTLSGGQRQRVAIARALIRKPEVLLLDEPTAALDSESEKRVVAALKNAMQKTKSMLMVTHRLGVIRSLAVNKVVVLDRGTVAEMGHPETLLKQNGIYTQLAREQGILPISK